MQVNARSLVPGAALWQIAAAAVRCLLDSSTSADPAAEHLLVQGTLPAPKALPQAGPCTLTCSISRDAHEPSLRLASDGLQSAPHMQCNIRAVPAPAPASAAGPAALSWLIRPGAPAASCLGTLATEPSSRQLSAAVLDSCLHLGASAPSASTGIRVPAGFAALCLPSSPTPAAWGSASAFSSGADGSALSSYQVSGGQRRLTVCALLARPMAPAQPVSGLASSAASLQYVLQAPVHELAGRSSTASSSAAIVWRDSGPGCPAVSTLLLRSLPTRQQSAGGVLRASLVTLAKLQMTFSSQPGSRQQLMLQQALPSSCAASEAAAAMLRTAAQEQPSTSWEVVATHANNR